MPGSGAYSIAALQETFGLTAGLFSTSHYFIRLYDGHTEPVGGWSTSTHESEAVRFRFNRGLLALENVFCTFVQGLAIWKF
jgi:hypothetical protein